MSNLCETTIYYHISGLDSRYSAQGFGNETVVESSGVVSTDEAGYIENPRDWNFIVQGLNAADSVICADISSKHSSKGY